MTPVLPRRRASVALIFSLLLGVLGVSTVRAQSAVDQIVNSGSANVMYKLQNSATFLTLGPGQSLPVADVYDIQNQSSIQAQLTTQRLVGSTWTSVFVIKLFPGSQGTFAPVGTICNVGQWTVTTYYYSGQYIGNLYARTSLVGLVAGAPAHGSGSAPIPVPPVLNVWGYESYAGGSRIEATTFDAVRTGGTVQLLGSRDENCNTSAYSITAQGQYVNWSNQGIVTAKTMPCLVIQSLPALGWPGVLALLAGLAALLAWRPRRAAQATSL